MEDGHSQKGNTHRGLQRHWRFLGRQKGGERTEEEAAEAARGAGMQGSRGTWGEGRGQQDIKRRYRRWRLEVVEACPGGNAIQY